MKKLAATAILATSLLASSAMAATVPYLYVYSINGSGGAPGPMTALLTSYINGPGSTVGLPSGLPVQSSASKPVIVQNGKLTGPVSATLVYSVKLGTVGSSNCTLAVRTPNVGVKNSPNASVTVLNDSAGMGLCTNFLVPVLTNNHQDGDQVITLNWKSKN